MRIPRIYHPGPLAVGVTVELDEAARNHVVRVLRLRAGAEVRLFNGEGGEYAGTLSHASKAGAAVEVSAFDAREVESSLPITLVQGISRGERMDFTIQKAVELGVARIVPVEMSRTVVALKGEKRARRRERWQNVAIAAAEQCGRTRVPEVADPRAFGDWLRQSLDGALGLYLDHRAESGVGALTAPASVTLLVGPEGGFAPEEREMAAASGYRGIRLGPRILRTETAGLAVLSVLQAQFGDLG